MRLKLYLTTALVAVSPPYDLPTISARYWASALDLPDSDTNGARRVNEAIGWLATQKLLVSERRRGTPGKIRLLSQSGTGEEYSRPVGRYVRLPLGLWSEGWMVRLSGTALTLLIILLDMQGGRAGPQWVAPSEARRRYDLSPDTWTKGLRELKSHRLVSVSRKPQGDIFDFQRLRNTYWVNREVLEGANPRPVRRLPRKRTIRRPTAITRIP